MTRDIENTDKYRELRGILRDQMEAEGRVAKTKRQRDAAAVRELKDDRTARQMAVNFYRFKV